ncbi:hypothetical protein Lepto7376_2544 [[Leptolyngbya] sp. PCC 7376]|nr:hypothetical protein Lepto7376_2544 [[Leptolyngbya] sp. PCC 7376]
MMSISLDSSPVDVWRVSPKRTAEIQNLNKAKEKLLEQSLPLSARAISYVRVCSVVMQILVKDLGDQMPDSYATILATLHSQDAQWWRDCYVDTAGFLQSKNTKIQALIQPLNTFVQKMMS